MMTQSTLFDDAPPTERCVTCGAARPDDHPKAFWLEPVSGECFDCNHRTVGEILQAARERRWDSYNAAWERHSPPNPRRKRRKR